MWKGNQYFYSTRVLKVIANNYTTLYDGLPLSLSEEVTNPWSLAEFKADFDMALAGIGRGTWAGQTAGCKFKDFRFYGRLQQIIIATILGIDDYKLMGLGFYSIPRLRGYAFYLMTRFLNGGLEDDKKPEDNTRRKGDRIGSHPGTWHDAIWG